MNLGLKDKVFVVTGGAAGIGAAICETLAKEDAIVVILDRQCDLGEGLSAQINQLGGKCWYLKVLRFR